jgi:hypothetical protein
VGRRSGQRAAKRPKPAETTLYAPVKAFLERQGYTVKGEIWRCDVLAVRGEEPPVVVELKTSMTMELVLQGIDRLAVAETVYLAVPAPTGSSLVFDGRFIKLLRRAGLGLLTVQAHRGAQAKVEAVLDPVPYRPRPNKKRTSRLLGEFQRRVGDPNAGGSTHRVKLVTAYRQEALRIASILAARGPQKVAVLRADAEAPKAGPMLQDDVYGWFERVERGIYALTPAGQTALMTFAGRFAPPQCLVTAAALPSAA